MSAGSSRNLGPRSSPGGSTPPGSEARFVDVFDAAEELPYVTVENLAAVTRTLALSGRVLMLVHDDARQGLVFYSVEPRIPCGPRAAFDEPEEER